MVAGGNATDSSEFHALFVWSRWYKSVERLSCLSLCLPIWALLPNHLKDVSKIFHTSTLKLLYLILFLSQRLRHKSYFGTIFSKHHSLSLQLNILISADKSLTRPSAKFRWKSSRLDFLGLRRYPPHWLSSPPHWLSSKGPNYQHGVLLISAGLVAVACFLPGRAKDLSARL
jgi:hypothetical protein